MLSYRHSFHAGNFADVLKHIVLIEILDHLTQKATAFEYIDTHSGAGLFNFASTDAQKLAEHTNGIDKLNLEDYPELTRYFEVINFYNKANSNETGSNQASSKNNGLNFYPGSPAIAQYFLRSHDRSWLYELHPQDFKTLSENFKNSKHLRVSCSDGLKGMLAIVPPTSRRGLVLIDPSYELKDEYQQVVESVIKAHKKFATGTYAIWYPVVERAKIDYLERKLASSGIKNIQRFELGLTPDTNVRGMTASGMIVINPPWKLFAKMQTLLPKLAKTLGTDPELVYKCEILCDE